MVLQIYQNKIHYLKNPLYGDQNTSIKPIHPIVSFFDGNNF